MKRQSLFFHKKQDKAAAIPREKTGGKNINKPLEIKLLKDFHMVISNVGIRRPLKRLNWEGGNA
ncbi:MAG: hypothetical protein J5654_11480 [Victivallales bacterium]|nr:hypothetical protein [Victivallales bacterium]